MIYANGNLIDSIRQNGSKVVNVTCYKNSTGKKHYVYYDYDVTMTVYNSQLTIYPGDYLGKIGVFYVYATSGFLSTNYTAGAVLTNSNITVDFPSNNLKGGYAFLVYFHPFCSDEVISRHMSTLYAMAADTKANRLMWSYNYDFLKTPGRRIDINTYTDYGYVTAADCNEQIFGFVTIPTTVPGSYSAINFIKNWYNAQ